MQPELRTGLYTLGKTVSGLSASNFFYGKTKHSLTGNYCTFFGVDDTHSFDSAYQFELVNVQFTFYGTVLSTLETLVSSFKDVFDFGTADLTASGYGVVKLMRTISVPPQRFENVWQIVLEYSVETEKTR